jgi:hypothetical protein
MEEARSFDAAAYLKEEQVSRRNGRVLGPRCDRHSSLTSAALMFALKTA